MTTDLQLDLKDYFTAEPWGDYGIDFGGQELNDDFFRIDNQFDTSVDWNRLYGTPDLPLGNQNNKKGGIAEEIDQWVDYLAKEGAKNQFLQGTTGNTSNIPNSMGGGSSTWWQGVPGTNVGIWGQNQGRPTLGASVVHAANAANKANSLGQMAGQIGGLDAFDVAKIGSSFAQKKLTNMALAAVPGVGPALVLANNLHPEGVVGAAKDVTGFLGDAGNTLAGWAGDAVSGVGNVVGDVWDNTLGRLFDWCDERVKVDIAPLERTEVNNELAQMAFFVKGLRECS
tara:strand:+ start:107 stop:958 length:852 start_codon:yes stop_codon:yes gene_type:complete